MSNAPNSSTGLPDIEHVRKLLDSLESGDHAAAERILDELVSLRETQMFRQLGKLTREIHEALTSFQLDSRITQLADREIPDAKERLNYVIEMTDQSAHRTLSAVEACLPLAEEVGESARRLSQQWARFRQRELSLEAFKGLTEELSVFFDATTASTSRLRQELSDVMLAQDFQDLTGQIIRRVITLVQEVEEKLVDLVRVAGRQQEEAMEADPQLLAEGEGPQPPKLAGDDRVSGQDDVDDLLSSLGF